MTDPRDLDDPRLDMDRGLGMEHRMGSPTPWGWIAGAVFIVVLLALIFTSSEGQRTASTGASPPATTGMAPRAAPPAVPVTPGQAPATTGQSSQ